MTSKSSFVFSTTKESYWIKFMQDLHYSSPKILIYYEAFSAGLWPSNLAEKMRKTNPSLEGQMIDHLDTQNLICLEKATFESVCSLAESLGVSLSIIINLYAFGQLSSSLFEKNKCIFVTTNDIIRVSHPSYSTDMSSLDFWLFGNLKCSFTWLHSSEPEELLEDVSIDQVRDVSRAWMERLRWVIKHNRDYYTSWTYDNNKVFYVHSSWIWQHNFLITL
jgi:hypothetical protein